MPSPRYGFRFEAVSRLWDLNLTLSVYRISSNKRPGAYKIFSKIAWALIGGGRLFKISKNVLNRKIKKAIDRFVLKAIRRLYVYFYVYFTKVYHFLVYFSILFFTLAGIIVNYLLRIILNIGFINIKRKHLYSINRPGRLLEGGAYFQHFKIRWALIRRGRLKEGGRLIEEIRYLGNATFAQILPFFH